MRDILTFELKHRLRRLSTYVYAAVFFVLTFLMILAAGGAFKGTGVAFGGGEKVMVNSPFALANFIGVVSLFGLPVVAAIMGRAVQQDFEYEVHPFFFTSPITKLQYLGGRYLAAFSLLTLIFSAIPVGALFASLAPWLDSSRVGRNQVMPYLSPCLFIVLPNLLFTGAVFFIMAALQRKILPVFLTAVIALVGYLLGLSLVGEMESKTVAALVDPFGTIALGRITEYWTIAERNGRLIPLQGIFLANRALWFTAAVVLFAIAYRRFTFTHTSQRGGSPQSAALAPEIGAGERELTPIAATPSLSPLAYFRLFFRSSWLQLIETIKNVYFVVITAAGVLFMVFTALLVANRFYGTPTYPVTHIMVELVGGSFFLFFYIIITFYSGELVWRDRDTRVAQIIDASPTPTWLLAGSKLFSLLIVQVLLSVVVMLTGMVLQAARGYFHFEPALYLKQLFVINLIRLWLISAFAVAVHVLVNQKYMGHFVMVIYYLVSRFGLSALGFEHHLYNYATAPPVVYSDMNGYGHFVAPIFWFDLYWGAFAVLLAIATNLFWVRGVDDSPRWRARLARVRVTPLIRVSAAATIVVFVAAGAFIFYNTNRLNHYRGTFQQGELQAQYEKKYKKFEKTPQARITDVSVAVDIFPSERRASVKGSYLLENKNDVPCTTVEVNVFNEADIARLDLNRDNKRVVDDKELGFYRFELAEPLQPHEKARLDFDLGYQHRGFVNGEGGTDIVYNGSFLNSGLLPSLGYGEFRELTSDEDRRKHGLQPKERMRDLNDPEGRKNNYISYDADWVTFDATVSTSADQIALAPGYLQREWTEGGRRYFHYSMDSKILRFFAFLSARYAVKRDHWNGVAIEIFYHPGHEYDLDRMMRSVKKSLDYYTRNFSPYQHHQVRIVEFPRYRVFAQSFPNTIPYSEGIGFIARVNDKDENDIDYPFYVTAHEVGHQWWGHQVIGARVQGSTLLSETLAQYSALMVMKAEFGPEKMRRFLRYELDRYLIGRTIERKKELPLLRVENQDYVHYRKGSLVMYALQDYIGDAAVNQALARYIQAVAFRGPPYTTAAELLDYLREVTPDKYQYVLEDMFENITLYDNRAVKAAYTERPDGKFEVRLTTSSKKVRADALGKEHEVPLDDWIDVGVLDEKGDVLYLQKERIDKPAMEFSIVVERRPAKAGIDPFNKLIDRKPDDNSIKVEKESAAAEPRARRVGSGSESSFHQ
jgi:hypothetical protein